MHLNPALSGTTFSPRIVANYRNQWPSIPNAYTTYAISYDQFVDKLSSGFGISLLADNAGAGILKTTRINLSYAYNLPLTDALFLRGGLQGGYVQKVLDWDKLLFYDQLDPLTGPTDAMGNPFPSLEERPDDLNRGYFDFSAGLMIFSPKFYAGLALKHLNSPNERFIDQNAFAGDLPLLLSIHGGLEINIKETNNKKKYPTFISPNLLFAKQAEFYQFNVGAYVSTGLIYGGAWFRHTFSNSDAAIALIGFQKGIFKIGYSYDYTISGLSSQTGGSHEIALTINFDELGAIKRRRLSKQYNDCLKIFR